MSQPQSEQNINCNQKLRATFFHVGLFFVFPQIANLYICKIWYKRFNHVYIHTYSQILG